MLRDMDYKLIKEEARKIGFKSNELKQINRSPFKILNHYYVHEFTTHWYDSDPPECDNCKEDCEAIDCAAWENWRGSEKRLLRETWIDVSGKGVWGMTQKQCDTEVRIVFENEIYKDGGWRERLFYIQPDNLNQIYLYYYNRDRGGYDYWFIFNRKERDGFCNHLDTRHGN